MPLRPGLTVVRGWCENLCSAPGLSEVRTTQVRGTEVGRVLGGALGPVPHPLPPLQPPAARSLQGRLDLPAETQGKAHVSPRLLPSVRHLPEGRASQTQGFLNGPLTPQIFHALLMCQGLMQTLGI